MDFEKLGLFYLGRSWDLANGEMADALTLYDSRDLTTHAVCVGMTGSGKTGLCIGLLEEAVLDGVPAIAIDVKGDIANLALTFPDLAPEDFAPWVSPEEARRKDLTVEAFAANEASKWRDGLAGWSIDGARIARLRESAELTVYTPGSTAGVPLRVVDALSAPPPETRDDGELLAERVSTAVSGLLGLVGVTADPVRSREHILLSRILHDAWSAGQDMTLADVIGAVQRPPFDRVGVLDLDAFYPEKARFDLAMQLNNLLASPAFAAWMDGEPLDIDRMLYTADGRPRLAIVSIAHLSDAERMFFMSLLLGEVVGWTRRQSGTSNLRALLYIDELFGFLPPTAMPPTKTPLLTLLKQARAFGLGVVLATQNPVDLDYKALSNAGTWFIGRLQTERDKLRVLEALEGATATAGGSLDRATIDAMLSGLGKRVFLLHNVHESAPALFHTRWVMSYLRGPMTRTEIRRLMDPVKAARAAAATEAAEASNAAADVEAAEVEAPVRRPLTSEQRAIAPATPDVPEGYLPIRPTVPSGVTEAFVPVMYEKPAGAQLAWRPCLLGEATVHIEHAKSGTVTSRPFRTIATFVDGPVPIDWSRGVSSNGSLEDCLADAPVDDAWWVALPDAATRSTSFTAWRKAFDDHLYRSARLTILHHPELNAYSHPGELERDFRIRLRDAAHRARSEAADALRDRYASRLRRIDEQIDTAVRRVDRERDQARRARQDAMLSAGSSVFGAILGGRRTSASTTMRRHHRASDQAEDVREAEARVHALQQEREALRVELEREIAALGVAMDPATARLEPVTLKPRRKDIDVHAVALLWVPVAVTDTGLQLLARVASRPA